MADLRTVASAPTYFLLAETRHGVRYFEETLAGNSRDAVVSDIEAGNHAGEVVAVFLADTDGFTDVTLSIAEEIVSRLRKEIADRGHAHVPVLLRDVLPDAYEELVEAARDEPRPIPFRERVQDANYGMASAGRTL